MRIRGTAERRQIGRIHTDDDTTAVSCWISDIESRILEQKREIDRATAQVMDILDYLPINSVERQICELRHIDFKPWGAISKEIPMSRSQTYRRYKMALDALLSNQRIKNIVEEHEREYDKYIHGLSKKESGDEAVENNFKKISRKKSARKTGEK